MSELKYEMKGDNGQLEVYDDKIIIKRKGVMAFFGYGLAGDKTIPMSAIQSVELKEGSSLVNGSITFGVLGSKKQSGALFDVWDENSIIIERKHNDMAREIKRYVESKIVEYSEPEPAATAPSISAADEIKKFKELLDAGIITQEEFDTKKRQLLGL